MFLICLISRRELAVKARSQKDQRPAPIYAILDDGMARVKRIERPEPGIVILGSDNPPTAPKS